MITEIIENKVVVKNRGKPTGEYLLSEFSHEELKEEKVLLTNQLFASNVEDTPHIFELIAAINGELDKRLLESLDGDKYFNLATDLTRAEAERVKNE